MRPNRKRVRQLALAALCCFSLGAVSGWKARVWFAPAGPAREVGETPKGSAKDRVDAVAAMPPEIGTAGATIGSDIIGELRRRSLRLPVDAIDAGVMKGQFEQRRGGGERGHEAVDLMAPRNTPVRAVDDGTVAKLFVSKQGGNTVYQFDPTKHACYYYAHLDGYAPGIEEGQSVARGQVLGYVGTTGNAPKNAPHLHFAIFELTSEQRWWQGRAIDPYLVYKQ